MKVTLSDINGFNIAKVILNPANPVGALSNTMVHVPVPPSSITTSLIVICCAAVTVPIRVNVPIKRTVKMKLNCFMIRPP